VTLMPLARQIFCNNPVWMSGVECGIALSYRAGARTQVSGPQNVD
jgi:hypothetical protein